MQLSASGAKVLKFGKPWPLTHKEDITVFPLISAPGAYLGVVFKKGRHFSKPGQFFTFQLQIFIILYKVSWILELLVIFNF